MRIVLAVLTALSLALGARAEDTVRCTKVHGVLKCEPLTVHGKPPRPAVTIVIPRSASAKKAVDQLGQKHLEQAAEQK